MLVDNSALRFNFNHYSLDFINSKTPQTEAFISPFWPKNYSRNVVVRFQDKRVPQFPNVSSHNNQFKSEFFSYQ